MKKLIIFLTINLVTSIQLKAQNCIDTVHIKGYYIIKKIASELSPEIEKNGNETIVKQRMDTHDDPSFIPIDSISIKHPLSYWLNHFFRDTKQVFISCEKFGVKDFLEKKCLQAVKKSDSICHFPLLKSNVLYKTTNINTGDVFEIYYLDAIWAKVKVKKGSLEADLIPSKIAQRCISPSVNEFDLYCFINYKSVGLNTKVKDKYIKVWMQ